MHNGLLKLVIFAINLSVFLHKREIYSFFVMSRMSILELILIMFVFKLILKHSIFLYHETFNYFWKSIHNELGNQVSMDSVPLSN